MTNPTYACSHYTGDTRCTQPATHWLYTPDRKRAPGCFYCREHAEEVLDEYADKLDQFWFMVPDGDNPQRFYVWDWLSPHQQDLLRERIRSLPDLGTYVGGSETVRAYQTDTCLADVDILTGTILCHRVGYMPQTVPLTKDAPDVIARLEWTPREARQMSLEEATI